MKFLTFFLNLLKCDNVKRVRWHSLVMVKGKRRVFVGLFPNSTRAGIVAAYTEWDGFYPEIREVAV